MPERLRNLFAGGSIPGWVINVLVGVLFSIALAWSGAMTKTVFEHTTEMATQKERLSAVKESTEKAVAEIKDSQRRIEDKLDRVLEGRNK